GLHPVVEILSLSRNGVGLRGTGAQYVDGAIPEQLVLHGRAAHRGTYFVTAEHRDSVFLEYGGPGQGVIAEVVIEGAVQVVGARICEDLDGGPRVSPLLGVEVIGLYVHGLHNFRVRRNRRAAAAAGRVGIGAVDQVSVRF